MSAEMTYILEKQEINVEVPYKETEIFFLQYDA